jgi:hypothetical protein
MADDKLKVSPGLEDRLLDYAAAAKAFGEHGASDLLPALPLLDSPEAFVAVMEAAILVSAVRSIAERREGYGSSLGRARHATFSHQPGSSL